MAEEIIWIDGVANGAQNIEKICPRRHITQSQWRPEWNEDYDGNNRYDYISDYECIFNHPIAYNHLQDDQARWQGLQDAKNQGTSVRITNLAHYTSPEAAEQIVNTNGFRGGRKLISDEIREAKFSWWSPVFNADVVANVRDHLGGVIQPFIGENDNQQALQNQFATSDAFWPNPDRRGYGKSFFQYGIHDLCQYYQNQVGGDELRYKILGTFGYKQEVMHAVLVCSQENGTGQFAAYPDVLTPAKDVNNEAVITRSEDGNWIWKPQATATEIKRLHRHWQKYPMYRRWEHVAFAFHIDPNECGENGMMMVEDLGDHQWEINDDPEPEPEPEPEPVALP